MLARTKDQGDRLQLTSPSAVAIAATGAEVGVLAGQGGRLDPVDGIGVGILGGDGSAALALADKRTLASGQFAVFSQQCCWRRRTYSGLGFILARQLLHVGMLLFGRHERGVRHAERGGAAVLVLASVLVVKGGRKDRGADW